MRRALSRGNPLAVTKIREGDKVLDPGSGGSIDVLLSARRVGSTGFAHGRDMTDGTLDLARANAAKGARPTSSFLQGQIEATPLPDASIDVEAPRRGAGRSSSEAPTSRMLATGVTLPDKTAEGVTIASVVIGRAFGRI